MEENYNIRSFKIEAVASVVEVVRLCDNKDIFDFCSFVMGEDVNTTNIHIYRDEIIKIINTDYPDMIRTLFIPDGYCLKKIEMDKLIHFYKTKYGDEILVRKYNKENSKKLIKRNN